MLPPVPELWYFILLQNYSKHSKHAHSQKVHRAWDSRVLLTQNNFQVGEFHAPVPVLREQTLRNANTGSLSVHVSQQIARGSRISYECVSCVRRGTQNSHSSTSIRVVMVLTAKKRSAVMQNGAALRRRQFWRCTPGSCRHACMHTARACLLKRFVGPFKILAVRFVCERAGICRSVLSRRGEVKWPFYLISFIQP